MQLPNIFLSETMARAICWTLIHSLWQGILIAALAGIIIYGTRKLPAALRYNLLAADLLLFLLLAGITFSYELHRQDPGHATTLSSSSPAAQVNAPVRAAALIEPAGHADLLKSINNLLDTHALLITGIWLVCLSVQLLRVSGGLYQTGRLRRNGTLPSGSYWIERLGVLARQLGIRRPVTLLETRGVQTPSAMGWWKPSILVPLGLLANLPPDQVETILLHELAHIRRNDFAANIVLHLTEAIFFFNPGLRWVASLLRREREACCDDMVLAGTPDRNSYLEALVSFTQWIIDKKPAGPHPYTLQFGGGKTDLLWRVRRMINQENKKLQPTEKLVLSFGLMALLSIGLVGMHPATVNSATVNSAMVHTATVHSAPRVEPQRIVASHSDTIPSPPAASGQKPITIEHLSVHSESNEGQSTEHVPTPEDPMVHNNFHNPYAKLMLLDLIRDSLAGDLNNISFVLTYKVMLVNDIQQPDNICQVYRAKYITHPGDHMIYSQYYTPQGSGSHCECVHEPDMPAPN